MGAGHDAVADELVARLTARGGQARRADVLDLLPAHAGAALRGFYRTTVLHLPLLYAGIYATFLQSSYLPEKIRVFVDYMAENVPRQIKRKR